jgi:myo-inositol-1-phosphate synthase
MGLSDIRVAVVGVGNCASALVQGLSYYGNESSNLPPPGLMHTKLGAYGIDDIVLSAAFDVDAGKVGHDVSEAIFAQPNNTLNFSKVPKSGVKVSRGETLDGIGQFLQDKIKVSKAPPVDVVNVLRSTGSQILVSYLPVGSQKASEFYANAAIEAGCAYVNCIPVFLASDARWRTRFEAAGVPIIGDDIKSQVGATIAHRALANLFRERGVTVDRTYQLNFGGNTDFLNMLERDRLVSKKVSKTQAVVSQLQDGFDQAQIHVGPSDYVPWLQDRKFAHIRIEGTGFGGAPLNLEVKLEVWDSPNSAGVVVDAIRCARIALDRKVSGAILGPSGYYMKSPPRQFPDEEARRMLFDFVEGDAGQTA